MISTNPKEENIVNNSYEHTEPEMGNMAGRVNTLAGTGPMVDRQPKAMVVMDRIRAMDGIVNRLCALRDTITDGNIPKLHTSNGEQDSPVPTLTVVLNEGPEILHNQYNQMVDIIGQIEKELF